MKSKRLTKRLRKALYGVGISDGTSPLARMKKTGLKDRPFPKVKIKHPVTVRRVS